MTIPDPSAYLSHGVPGILVFGFVVLLLFVSGVIGAVLYGQRQTNTSLIGLLNRLVTAAEKNSSDLATIGTKLDDHIREDDKRFGSLDSRMKL